MTTPPPVSVKLSLSTTAVSRSDDKPAPTLIFTITNHGDHAITLKRSGWQPCKKPKTSDREPELFPLKTIVAEQPSLDNLHIRRIDGGEDAIRLKSAHIQNVGSGGWKRGGFVTLEPGKPLVRTVPFLENVPGLVKRMGDEDGEFRITLRQNELWWFEGSENDIFTGQENVKKLPSMGCTPLVPHAENEVTFQLVD